MLVLSNAELDSQNHDLTAMNSELTKLYDSQPYTAYTEDLEFMWRWTIYQDNKLVQEGCSLTLDASKRSVEHVMTFFNMKRQNTQLEQEL
ncbi:MAG: soluble methane monooxygenase-binding protein MmoD [Methylococcales bacterium]|nr:soluble methane monooxygenase-binding protein MmoD [Methylococcaceae bacterium]